MIAARHAVRRETLDVDVTSEALAFALQPRLSDLNRARLLPAIERVLDELSPEGRRVRIDRLDLDLGAFSASTVERDAEDRLVSALRRTLSELLGWLAFGPVPGSRVVSETEARRELLAHYLLAGVLPFGGGPALSLDEMMVWMMEADPAGVAQVVRMHGRHEYVLERIVAQLSEAALHGLIRVLEPRYAALILEYVADLEETHRDEPVLPVGDRDLSHLVWVLVTAYLVQDPGSQFNRKSFVKALIEGLAASEGLEYAEVLHALRVGLEWMSRKQPLRSSLPAVVAELVRELGEPVAVDPPAPLPRERAEALEELTRIFNQIPAPYRPRPEDRLRRVLTEALLAHDDGAPLDEAFHAGVLAELFAWPLAEPVSRFLLDATGPSTPLRAAVLAASRASVTDEPEALSPARAEALDELMAIFNQIPVPYRPRPEDRLRRVLIAALLAHDDGAPLDEAFYAGLLAELFAWPLAEPVTRFLLDATADDEGSPLRTAMLAATRGDVLVLAQRDQERRLRKEAADRRTRERWAAELSEKELQRIAATLAPRRHRVLLAAAEVLAAAWRETAPPGHPALTERRAFWSFMLGFVARHPASGHSVERLVAAFFEHSAARYLAAAPVAPDLAVEGGHLLDRANRLARAAGDVALVAIFHRDRRILLAPWERVRASGHPARRGRLWHGAETAAEEASPIYIENAGLVLTAPFLPHLFGALDLYRERENGRPVLRDGEAASRAVHLLQSLADGSTWTPEPLLVLNKILCGMPVGAPVARGIEPTDPEKEIGEKVLRSMLASWTAIANTSVAGLQETFLRRDGKLLRIPDGWKLEVQRRTVDFLVDEVPWNHSVICHRWMPQPLYVSW
jgi:hypothetical protein